jgi:transcriptional regulator with XRE-family HTH domain/tetratricopeptide (TPR) repeat protein
LANLRETQRWTAAHGKRLKERRIEKRMSQKAAAALLQVSDDTWRNWENGTTQPRDESLAALAEFFEVGLHELLNPEVAAPPPPDPVERTAATEHVVEVPVRRTYRFWLGALGLALVAALALIGVIEWRRGRTFKMLRRDGNGVEAISHSGEVLWQATGVDPVIAERWTLVRMPGGRTLVACVLAKPADFRPEIVSILSLVEPNAQRLEVMERITLPAPGGKLFPDYARRYELAYLNAVDLDGDGIDEILATYQQVPECVSYTVLYEPAIRRARVVFVQTGAHHLSGAWDIDGDGRHDLVFLGINNGYNWVNALAAVRVKPWVGKRSVGDEMPVFSPDSINYLPTEPEALFYTLLPRGRVPDDPDAVSWGAKRRRLSVKLATGREIPLSPLGFLIPPKSALPEMERRALRREAYRHDRESRRLAHAGFMKDAVRESRQAVAAAERAADEILTEAMQRDLIKALIAAGSTPEAEELVTLLVRTSENASEIFYDAAVAFHLSGDLRRAIRYYEAGIRRGGSPEAGKSKHEFIQAEVFALVELGEFDAAEQAIDRFRDRYVTGDADWSAPYREFVRWQRGAMPRPESVDLSPNATDLLRYWKLEFRNARGEEPATLLHETDALLAEGNRPRSALLSLRSVLLARLGRAEDANATSLAASAEYRSENRTSVTARGHGRAVNQTREQLSYRGVGPASGERR